MATFDVTDWGKRNVWRSDGQMCVRPGLRRLTAATGGRKWVGGFSIQNPWTLEVWHYIADVSTAGHDLVIRVLDDDFVEWQALKTGVDVIPRGFSFGVVEGEIMIGSPDMPTLWGYVGGALTIASKVDSDNPGTTAIAVPRGVVCSVLNRIVIADGASLFISDPVAVTGGSPRTFVAQNQNQRPGVIFGVHEGAGGNLVVVTSAGVYSLDPSAFAVQIVGSNGTDWRLVNRTEAYSYDSSANVKGRIYGLTEGGFALIDVEGGETVPLNEDRVPLRLTRRIALSDWRGARIFAGDDGPIIADDIAAGASGPVFHMVDSDGFRSWWSGFTPGGTSAFVTVRGVLRDGDGAVLLLAEDGAYAVEGNCDYSQATPTTAQELSVPRAYVFARLPADPEDNPIVRSVFWTAEAGANLNVRGAAQTAQGGGTTATFAADTRCIIVGTTSWGASGVWYQDSPMGAVRFDCNFASPDLTIDMSTTSCLRRIGSRIAISLSDSAPKRTPTRGA
jgi:hypothetical protein